MIRVALVVILLLGGAFGYREMTKPSAHDQAVASLKSLIAHDGQGDPASVSCNAKPSPVPPGYAAYGNMAMFDCSYANPSTGTVVDTCMMHGGKLAQVSDGWATDGSTGSCAAGGRVLANLANLATGAIPSLPAN
ncbi:MAG: hypothetical protein ACRD3Q_17075 [Terriglobales bacterium]